MQPLLYSHPAWGEGKPESAESTPGAQHPQDTPRTHPEVEWLRLLAVAGASRLKREPECLTALRHTVEPGSSFRVEGGCSQMTQEAGLSEETGWFQFTQVWGGTGWFQFRTCEVGREASLPWFGSVSMHVGEAKAAHPDLMSLCRVCPPRRPKFRPTPTPARGGEILGLAFSVLQTGSYFYLPRSITNTRRAISEGRVAPEGPEFNARVMG